MIVRILRAIVRYTLAFNNLGLSSTLKIIYYSAISETTVDTSMTTKKFGKIFWNTKKDWVITHFYTPQIEIYSPTKNVLVQTIVDLGANIGTESKRFARLYPNAKIIAVEAEKRNFEILQKNTSENSSIKTVHAAIWNNNSPLKLISGSIDSQAWHLSEAAPNENYDMMGVTFGEIIDSSDISSIDILKVDIEGAERVLFGESCKNWIHKVKCLIVECPDSDSPLTTSLMYRNFDKANYIFKDGLQKSPD